MSSRIITCPFQTKHRLHRRAGPQCTLKYAAHLLQPSAAENSPSVGVTSQPETKAGRRREEDKKPQSFLSFGREEEEEETPIKSEQLTLKYSNNRKAPPTNQLLAFGLFGCFLQPMTSACQKSDQLIERQIDRSAGDTDHTASLCVSVCVCVNMGGFVSQGFYILKCVCRRSSRRVFCPIKITHFHRVCVCVCVCPRR